MPSTFFGLNIGYTGLVAANAALHTTGNNIANVETEGFSRQEVAQEAGKALRTNTTYGMAGAGVDTIAVNQIRNEYYDLKFWDNNSNLGIYSIKQQYARQIEDYFTDTDDVKGFAAIFDDLTNSLVEVYKSSGDDNNKEVYLSQCKTLCEYFDNMYHSLQKLQSDANAEIANRVNHINALASEIATLNKQINTIEVNGPRANELRDKRSLLIDDLSKIVDVDVKEIPIYKDSHSNEESGAFTYVVNIAGGQSLVYGYDYSQLKCTPRSADEKVNQSDADGLYNIRINNTSLSLQGGELGGELKGLLQVRDGNNGEYFWAKESTASGNTVSVTINKNDLQFDYLSDMNKSTLNPTGTIEVGGKEFKYTGWKAEFDKDSDGNPTAVHYTFDLEESAAEYNGKPVQIGKNVNYQGIPYYMSQMNEWVRSYTQAINKIELGAQDCYGNAASVVYTCGTEEKTFEDYDYNDKYATTSSADDNYLSLTAATVNVSSKMIKDVNLFGTTKDINQGQDAQDITEELLTVPNDKSKVSFRGCTAGEFLQCLTADVALNASSANSFTKNFDKISTAITNQRLSVMGVDNDEEALNLVKYQEAYNLASKMIQVMSEVYDRLIQQTGV